MLRLEPRYHGSRIIHENSLFEILVQGNREKILITRKHPDRIKYSHVYPIWLSKISHPKAISPFDLHVLEYVVRRRLDENGSDVIFDALEYLLLERGLEVTMRFIAKLRDLTILNGTDFYVTVTDAVEGRVFNILKRILE